MDQDFHYYGTYYAARVGGSFTTAEATVIAKASNFIDFLNNTSYGGYWRLVRDTQKRSTDAYQVIGDVNSPRYTFQGTLSSGVSPEDGLWGSYHFTPGNYPDPRGTPSVIDVHGSEVAKALPGHVIRDTTLGSYERTLLNRPQSALSRALVADTIACATDDSRLEQILLRSIGGWELLRGDAHDANLARFRLLLIGARAHVIADTWAHQDWSPIDDEMNTYWDIGLSVLGRQSIDYQDTSTEWKNVVLSVMKHENLKAVPNGTSYLGHGWMGHLPDYSFIKYRYRPCWRAKDDDPLVRDNPTQYRYAFLELCSMFAKCSGSTLDPSSIDAERQAADAAMSAGCEIANKDVCPRKFSAEQWVTEMAKVSQTPPDDMIDTKQEPDPLAVLPGLVQASDSSTRYGTYYVTAASDLYMFQVAADYHFRFVEHWLRTHKIMTFEDSWSTQIGPVSPMVADLF